MAAREEVRVLVEHFQKNMEGITSLHRLFGALEDKYRSFWCETQAKCELTQHDAKTVQSEVLEYERLKAKKDSGTLNDSAEILRYGELKSKYYKKRSRSYSCMYCGKQLREGHSFWEASFPQKIYRKEYLMRWLEANPEDWPEDKRGLLAEIKAGIGDYLNMAEPLQEKIKELTEDQIATRAELSEIFNLCDSVLQITQRMGKTGVNNAEGE